MTGNFSRIWLFFVPILSIVFFVSSFGCDDDDPGSSPGQAPEGDDDSEGEADDPGSGPGQAQEDDDNDDDDDNDEDLWPENVKPVVGWVFTWQMDEGKKDYVWDGFYQVTADDYEEVAPPGDAPFFAGSLPTRDVGWALTDQWGINELYRLEDENWSLMDPQPPCPAANHPNGKSLAAVRVFPAGSGYVLCTEDSMMEWDLAKWTAHDLPVSDLPNWGLDCLDHDRCVTWNEETLFWWDGEDFAQEERYGTIQAVIQSPHLVSRTFWETGGEGWEYASAELRNNSGWTDETIPFIDDIWSFAMVRRIDDRHGLFSWLPVSGQASAVLKEDGTVIDTTWPIIWWANFGESGGGIGVSLEDHVLYRLIGTEAEPIFTIGFFHHMLVLAADAE